MRLHIFTWILFLLVFQSTHPSWGATAGLWVSKRRQRNFNPRTHRGVRQCFCYVHFAEIDISIHAPIVGCDWCARVLPVFYSWISIHAPIVGCDYDALSKPSKRQMISIHAPIVGCDLIKTAVMDASIVISIHAPIVGCDNEGTLMSMSTNISIHAPIVGCDNLNLYRVFF